MMWSPIISFKDLEIELCNAKTKRKEKSPVFDKLAYETIPYYYQRWGQVFRKTSNRGNTKKDKYYTMEEVQVLYLSYIIEHKIKPTGRIKGVLEHDYRTTE